MSRNKHSSKVPTQMQVCYELLTERTDDFCENYLNEEYKCLIQYAIAALCRKRPSPLLSGRANTWAATIIYSIGSINFLFDKSQKPYLTSADIASEFNISRSTMTNKAREVKKMLNMDQFNHHWCLPALIEQSPLAWMITVDGFIIDARTLPIEIQEAAYKKGLIPYIYAESV